MHVFVSISTMIAISSLCLWCTALTLMVLQLQREVRATVLALQRVADKGKHVGGTRRRRDTDFRVTVNLRGLLKLPNRTHSCRVVDLSSSGAQVLPDEGRLPVGDSGSLSIDFDEFDSANSHVRIIRFIEPTGAYGLKFTDSSPKFRDRCLRLIRKIYREQFG